MEVPRPSPHPIETRLAVVEEKIDDLEAESLRHRDRLHQLEGMLGILTYLSEQVASLMDKVEAAAKRAAVEAVELVMQHRDEVGHRRWTLRLQWVGAGVGVGGLVAVVITHYT